jgi:hypothetical protein
MAGYDRRNRRTGARGDHPAHHAELDVGFVRAVFELEVARDTTKLTFYAGKFAQTRTTRASVASFGGESHRSHILTVGEPPPWSMPGYNRRNRRTGARTSCDAVGIRVHSRDPHNPHN